MWWSLARVAVLSFGVDALARVWPSFAPWAALATAAVLIFETHWQLDRADAPAGHFGMAWFGRDDNAEAPVRSLRAIAREWALGTAIALVIAIPYIYVAGQLLPVDPRHLRVDAAALVTPLLHHTLVVALPEEAYFRGFLQTRLAERMRGLAAPQALAHPVVLAAQAGLFAVLHLTTEPHPVRLLVAFPAVLFGLLRAWRRDIVASVAMHATFNLAGLTLSAAL